jgi:hypothetical protein
VASTRFQRQGKWYKVVVLHVTKSDAKGRPAEGRILYEEDKVHVQEGDEFVTCFIPEVVALPQVN